MHGGTYFCIGRFIYLFSFLNRRPSASSFLMVHRLIFRFFFFATLWLAIGKSLGIITIKNDDFQIIFNPHLNESEVEVGVRFVCWREVVMSYD